jgi:pimeloyl-ACP methyl ester carboxylesterase
MAKPAKQVPIAQRSGQKLRFDHKDMDFYFSWVVGRELYDGSARGECLAVAEHIVDGDPESWQREWSLLAERVEHQAACSGKEGDVVAARRAYLRACTYHRAPLFLMRPDHHAFDDTWRRMRDCFRKAAALVDPPIEVIGVPFQGKRLSGYFWKPDNGGQRRPTLIVIGGLETFAEDCYFMIGPAGTRRGYNVLTADLPGQGDNPNSGLFFEARMGPSVEAVVDYALARPEIDPDRLALFGFSWGGHIVFKGAERDRRIKALIANPPMPDVFRAARAQQAHHGRGDRIGRMVIEQIAWRMGVRISLSPRNFWRRLAKAYDYFRFGKTKPSDIRCPTLCIAGEGEARITLDVARECFAQLPNPKKRLVIFTRAEGGEAHCQVNNLALPNRVMFDWLDDVFAPR